MSLVKNSSILETAWFFFGYYDQFSDWWIWMSGPGLIGRFNRPITGVRLQSTV